MTNQTKQTQKGAQMAKESVHHHRNVYAACLWCPCTEEWQIKAIFLCRKDAIKYADDKSRYAIRCNRPTEHWHVEKYWLDNREVVWGAKCVQQADDIGAPDCV